MNATRLRRMEYSSEKSIRKTLTSKILHTCIQKTGKQRLPKIEIEKTANTNSNFIVEIYGLDFLTRTLFFKFK